MSRFTRASSTTRRDRCASPARCSATRRFRRRSAASISAWCACRSAACSLRSAEQRLAAGHRLRPAASARSLVPPCPAAAGVFRRRHRVPGVGQLSPGRSRQLWLSGGAKRHQLRLAERRSVSQRWQVQRHVHADRQDLAAGAVYGHLVYRRVLGLDPDDDPSRGFVEMTQYFIVGAAMSQRSPTRSPSYVARRRAAIKAFCAPPKTASRRPMRSS